MQGLSVLFYILAAHPIMLAFGAPLAILAVALGLKLAGRRSRLAWWAIPVFIVLQFNIFLGQWANAAFLHAAGIDGRAVIVDARETSSRLNEQPVWAYEAVVRTRDGRDVKARFTTMSVSIWPIRNRILIPPQGETFAVRYVPGFARNIVIMSDESAFGRRRLQAEWRAPVEKAARQLAVSPDNPAFAREYRDSLRDYLDRHADADPKTSEAYRRQLALTEARLAGRKDAAAVKDDATR